MGVYAPALAASIAGYIVAGEKDDAAFTKLALHLFVYQYERNVPYRRFCDGRGVTPDAATSWRDIPTAPAAAFKRFALSGAPEADCTPERGGRVFHSSGTTGAETSRHFLDEAALGLYDFSLMCAYRRFVLSDKEKFDKHTVFALMPDPESAPHSSLSYMLGSLTEGYGGGFFWGDGWQGRLSDALASTGDAVTIFGTAFAWVHFFDSTTEAFALPAGSRVVETGGFKGRSREVSRDELYALFTERLGVPPTHCVSEYGMSEMASQFYDSTLRDHLNGITREPRKVAPPWLKTRILDPVSGTDAAPGQPGLLAHYDLANLNSVLAIQTEDMGIAAPDGDGFTLLGRAPGAVLRGCSLTAEELLR
jgi:hypothetical protein